MTDQPQPNDQPDAPGQFDPPFELPPELQEAPYRDENPDGNAAPVEAVPLTEEPDGRGVWRSVLAVVTLVALTGYAFFIAQSTLAVLVLVILAALVLLAVDAGADLRHVSPRGVIGWFKTQGDVAQAPSPRRDRLLLGLYGAAFVLMALAASAFAPDRDQVSVANGFWLMFFGAVLLGVALFLGRVPRTVPLLTAQSAPAKKANPLWVLVGLVLLLLVAEMGGNALGMRLLDRAYTYLQFVVFLAGLLALVWGLANPGAIRLPRPKISRSLALEAITVAAIILLALWLRLDDLQSALRASVDEAVAVQGVLNIWWENHIGLVAAPSSYNSTHLIHVLQALIVELSSPSMVTMRVISAIFGTLTVLALYVYARTAFDRRVALVSALILATFPPHLHFSRIALPHIGDTLFGMLVVAFIARALKDNRRLDWVLGGVSLGLTQYFFEAGRLFYPPFVLVWLGFAFLMAWRTMVSRWPGLLVMLIAATLVAMPVHYTISARGTERAARLAIAGIGPDYWENILEDGVTAEERSQVIDRFTLPFQVYVHYPSQAAFYGGDAPMVLTALIPLFLMGLFTVFWRLNPLNVVIVLWLLLVPLSNGLLRDSLVYARYVVVLPAVALVIAVAIAQTLPAALKLIQRQMSPRVIAVPVVALALLVAGIQVVYYREVHLPVLNAQLDELEGSPDGMDAVLRMLDLPENSYVVAISDPMPDINVMRTWLTFFRSNKTDMQLEIARPLDINEGYLAAMPGDRPLAFFVDPTAVDAIQLLAEHFTLAGPIYTDADIPQDDVYVLYTVIRDQTGTG